MLDCWWLSGKLWRLLELHQFLFSIRNGVLDDSVDRVPDRHARLLIRTLTRLNEQCAALDLPFVGPEIDRFVLRLKLGSAAALTQAAAREAIDAIHHRMMDVFQDAVFLNVSAGKARYHSAVADADASWERQTIDESIGRAFPSAVPDLRAAFDCYATENNTACVFHLMRAVEHGLRAFAVAVGVQTTGLPLEHQQWQRVIEQAEARIRDAKPESWSQPAKERGLAFLQTAVADFRAFKDSVRNLVMHARPSGTYDEHHALSILNRVLESLARLATRVSERHATLILEESVFAEPHRGTR